MNQSILFNDDLTFDQQLNAWKVTGLMVGELLTIYVHLPKLRHKVSLDSSIKYDLEEIIEAWLQNNEPESSEIHIYE